MIFTLCINDQLTFYSSYYWPGPLQVHQLLITPPSPHTNPLLGIVQLGDQGLTCLVVPYHPLGNLRRYIADQRANLTAIQQMQLIHDIASGLEFLHQRGIHHLNLHSANVLITLQGMAILTDVGRANNRAEVGMPPKPTVEQERVRSLAVVFLAPEILASNSYSSRSDVYALGMVMFELLTGRVAFEKDLDRPGLSTKVMFGRQDEIPANIKGSPGPAYEALIKDCWKLNPAERP
ncbi:kinase-like domain-containing protein, partial [Lobosporangium transversale]